MTDSNVPIGIATFFAFSIVAVITVALVVGVSQRRPAADPAPGCAEWSDGCVICRRGAEGAACSTPGIACIRGPVRCERRL